MNWIFCDLDATLVDTKALLDANGPEPVPGTKEHERWVDAVTNPEILSTAPVVRTIGNLIGLVAYPHDNYTRLVFVTNRRESCRRVTELWLHKIGFYQRLCMRPEGELCSAGDFKGSVISATVSPGDTVLVLDDDPDGSIERVCRQNGWTHLKVVCY